MTDTEELERLPVYFRPWDLAQVILAGRTYRIEEVGMMSDGGVLFAVYVCVMQALT